MLWRLQRDRLDGLCCLKCCFLQIQEIRSNTLKTATNVLKKAGSKRQNKPLKVTDSSMEVQIQADYDASKLKSCKMAKN